MLCFPFFFFFFFKQKTAYEILRSDWSSDVCSSDLLGDDIEVALGDARTTIDRGTPGQHDVVIGDAFGGVAVPWHLATREFTAKVHARLRPGGVYTLNLIDYGPRSFLRAEVATVAAVFDHVAVLGRPGSFDADGSGRGGNYVLVASDAQLPIEDILAANARRGRADELLSGQALTRFVADARVLTDDR